MKVLKLLLLFAMGASLSLAGCDDDYLYPVEYPVYDPDGGSDNGGGDEIPVPEKVNNKVVAHRGGSAEAGTAKYPDNSIASLSYAISLGCYASECDIYWTADNNVVVAHAANGCYVNNLKPWEHTLDELRAAGKLSNGELLPTLEEFIDVALHAGTTRLWLDVKRIEVGGATSNTAESVKACSRACEIIREKKAQHFCEFIVSGNAAIWAGCYSAAQLAGIKVCWMSYSAPSAYKSYLDPCANLDYSNFFAGGAEVSNPKYPLQSYLDAGVALSVYNADTDPEMTYVLKYYPKMKAVCTNYPAKLLGRIGSEGL